MCTSQHYTNKRNSLTAIKNWDNFKEHLRFSYKAIKCTSALTVQEALKRDNVMNLVTTVITNVFDKLQGDVNSIPDNPTSSMYDSNTPPQLFEPTSDASVMNIVTSTVSDIILQTMK